MNEDLITLQLPANAEYVDLVRMTLYGIAAKMGFSYEEIEDMKVAVSEACNNAVLHAYDASSGVGLLGNNRMEIRFLRTKDALSIIVKDEGLSFHTPGSNGSSSPLAGKSIEDITAGGLGLYLMKALMDHVEVNSGAGTEVILTKRLVGSEETA